MEAVQSLYGGRDADHSPVELSSRPARQLGMARVRGHRPVVGVDLRHELLISGSVPAHGLVSG
jgi:hypothetical protein